MSIPVNENYPITQFPNYSIALSALKLGILLHQFLQAEAWKLYSNLGFFAFSFALIDRAFPVFGVADLLSGAETALAGRLFYWRFGDGELLAAAGEKLGDVLASVGGAGRNVLLRSAGPWPRGHTV